MIFEFNNSLLFFSWKNFVNIFIFGKSFVIIFSFVSICFSSVILLNLFIINDLLIRFLFFFISDKSCSLFNLFSSYIFPKFIIEKGRGELKSLISEINF